MPTQHPKARGCVLHGGEPCLGLAAFSLYILGMQPFPAEFHSWPEQVLTCKSKSEQFLFSLDQSKSYMEKGMVYVDRDIGKNLKGSNSQYYIENILQLLYQIENIHQLHCKVVLSNTRMAFMLSLFCTRVSWEQWNFSNRQWFHYVLFK